jgi:hypothetical protein
MAVINRGHLQEEKLIEDAQKATQGCRDFLLQPRYRPQADYEICDDSRLKERLAFFTQPSHGDQPWLVGKSVKSEGLCVIS